MSARRVGALLALLAGSSSAAAPRQGHVTQATHRRAYLDAGALDGLAVGNELSLLRGGGVAGTCVLDAVADHRATCTGLNAQQGDAFALPELPAAPETQALRAPALSPEAKAQELLAVQRAPLPPIEFRGDELAPGLPGEAPRFAIELAHVTWASAGAGPMHQERLDLNAHGVPLGAGVTLGVDLSARHWTRQGDDPFRPDTPDQLYIWEAQVSTTLARSWFGSLGRLSPWSAPGAPRIDGAQVGYRSEGGDELGLYGGLLPDPGTLAPGLERATGGLFWSVQRRASSDSAVPVLLQQGRVDLISTPEGGQRFEGELSAQSSLFRAIDLAGDARLGAGGATSSGLEALRFDLGARPLARLSLTGGFRYIGIALPQFAALGASSGGPSREGDAAITYELFEPLQISAAAGLSHDLITGLSRNWIGPDLSLPTLFGARGGLTLGYREESGWLAGRSAWAQSALQPFTRLRLLLRLTWTQDVRPDLGSDQSVGLFCSASAQLFEHAALRFDFLTRGDPLSIGREGVPSGLGGMFDVGLNGTF